MDPATIPRRRVADSGNQTDGPSTVPFSSYVIAIMLVLLIAAIIDGAAPKRLSRIFPAPILMFILVLVVALIALASDSKGFVYDVTFAAVDSDVLQTIYLPPLLFSDVMRLNIRVFRRSFWQVMWLIFPGVVGGAALTAVYPLFMMPSGPPFFSSYEAFAFGGALSTTDPIAVLMVLNDIGAPKRLAAMVGGESLLNDGTSIVIVTLFLMLQEGVSMSGGDIVGFCFQEILAGPCFGLVMGILTLFVMRQVEKNTVALVMLSFAMPYLTFTVCLYYFTTSGVLAVIALGLVLNRFGHAFLNKNLEAVEGFWDQVEFIATMILYAQVGMFVAADFLQGNISGTDWGSLVGLFLWILLVRLVVVVVSFPLLTRIGYGLSWQEAIVVWHAGLRGAVSILLSFSIKNAPGVTPRTGALVLFFTAGIVVLFLINVVTTGPLCRLLGLQFDFHDKVYCRMKFKIEEATLKTLMCTGMTEDVARKGISFFTKEGEDDPGNDRGTSRDNRDEPVMMNQSEQLQKTNSEAMSRNEKSNSKLVSQIDADIAVSAAGDSGLRATEPATHSSTVGIEKVPVVDEEMLARKRQHLCMAFKATFDGLLEAELIPRTTWFLLVNTGEKKIDTVPVHTLLRFEDLVAPQTFFRFFAKSCIAVSNLWCFRGESSSYEPNHSSSPSANCFCGPNVSCASGCLCSSSRKDEFDRMEEDLGAEMQKNVDADLDTDGKVVAMPVRSMAGNSAAKRTTRHATHEEDRMMLKEMLLNRFSSIDEMEDTERKTENIIYHDYFSAIETLAYCAFGMIVAHQRGRRVIHEIFAVFDESESDEADRDQHNNTNSSNLHLLSSSKTKQSLELQRILAESREDCARPARFLDLVFRRYPQVMERIKSAHARAQVHDKNIQVVGTMKRTGFVSGVALKQLLLEVERLDQSVEHLKFRVVSPLSVGKSGEGLLGNPNFGPFVQQKQGRGRVIGRTSTALTPSSRPQLIPPSSVLQRRATSGIDNKHPTPSPSSSATSSRKLERGKTTSPVHYSSDQNHPTATDISKAADESTIKPITRIEVTKPDVAVKMAPNETVKDLVGEDTINTTEQVSSHDKQETNNESKATNETTGTNIFGNQRTPGQTSEEEKETGEIPLPRHKTSPATTPVVHFSTTPPAHSDSLLMIDDENISSKVVATDADYDDHASNTEEEVLSEEMQADEGFPASAESFELMLDNDEEAVKKEEFDKVLDHVDAMLAGHVESDPDLKVTL